MFVVAGVTGHVGGVVAQELSSHGEKIKVIVRDPKKAAEWSAKGAEVALGSLEDKGFLTGALRGATGFFALLPPNFAAADYYGWQKTTGATLAEAVKANATPHVVLLSSVGADLDTGNGPIKGLFHLENALRATGTVLTAIRAGYFQENIANSIEAARTAGIFPNFTPSADYPMPMISTRDIGTLAATELRAKPSKSQIVDLHGPAYSIRQLAEKLGTALGKTLQVVDIPPAAHVETMVKAGLPPQIASAYAEMYAGFASGKIQPHGDRMVQGKTTIDETLKTLLP